VSTKCGRPAWACPDAAAPASGSQAVQGAAAPGLLAPIGQSNSPARRRFSVRIRGGPLPSAKGAPGCCVKVSAPALGAGGRGSSPCVPTHGSLAQREEHPVEAREVPVRFRGEPPNRARLTAKTPVLQTGHRGSIPRHGSRAPLAQLAEYPALTRGVGDRCPRGARSAVPIRSTGRTALSGSVNRGSNPRWAAMPPRTAAAPLSYSGWPGSAPGGGSTCSYSNFGREASPRCWMLRVRIPPSARLLCDNGKHSSLVRRQSGFDSPGRLACGCSSARSEHLPATEKVARSNRVSRSHAALAQLRQEARGPGPRQCEFESHGRH
jgi:hypothetical protein